MIIDKDWLNTRSFEQMSKEEFIYREPNSGCWLWLGCKWSSGYGYVRRRKKMIAAHRYMYALYKGNFNRELDVLHRCDVKCCVNPDHLFLGTHTDNMRDMLKKGRGANRKGEKNNKAKLTEESIREIRDKYLTGKYTQTNLAKEYNVCQVNISAIVNNKTWIDL